jgi:hypothetical protein
VIGNNALEVPVFGKAPVLSSGRSHPGGAEYVNYFEREKEWNKDDCGPVGSGLIPAFLAGDVCSVSVIIATNGIYRMAFIQTLKCGFTNSLQYSACLQSHAVSSLVCQGTGHGKMQ